MIGRRFAPPSEPNVEDDAPRGFDDYELRLGDIMRGERATLGKSLLDVQRELKIKASYIAAIENSDPSAFETPGFVAGYVRSYARYLGLDPEWAFSKFCEEGGFAVVHGLAAASVTKKTKKRDLGKGQGLVRDPFVQPNTPFVPRAESVFARIEPGALGSSLVLVALIALISYGGWSVLTEVQRVQLAPIDQTPGVTDEVDALVSGSEFAQGTTNTTTLSAPSPEALDRLYRPQALEVPRLVARDAPISTLDPDASATLVESTPNRTPSPGGPIADPDPVARAVAEALGQPVPDAPPRTPGAPSFVQVTEADIPEVVMYASQPSWVRVTRGDGTVLFEKILEPEESWALPKTEVPPRLRTGYAGAIYFVVEGEVYGPAGEGASVESNIALGADDLRSLYTRTDDLQDVDVGDILRRAIYRRQSGN